MSSDIRKQSSELTAFSARSFFATDRGETKVWSTGRTPGSVSLLSVRHQLTGGSILACGKSPTVASILFTAVRGDFMNNQTDTPLIGTPRALRVRETRPTRGLLPRAAGF
jgi:hypothetical protein